MKIGIESEPVAVEHYAQPVLANERRQLRHDCREALNAEVNAPKIVHQLVAREEPG